MAMKVGEIRNREVIVLDREATIPAAAQRMRWHHVGSVVVTEQREGALVKLIGNEQQRERQRRG
jgi:predicted transcriptional regulator